MVVVEIRTRTLFCLLIICFISIAFVECKDQPGATWKPSPHYTKDRGGKKVKWLILHGTAGGSSADNVATWFQNPKAQASTHYVVGQDGAIVQCVKESDTAWANGIIENGADPWWKATGNPNQVTISIEHVKSKQDNSNELTTAQKNAAFKLIKDIIRRNPGIRNAKADSSGGITGHFSISPKSRARCPGPYPWNELFAYLK